MYSIHRFHGGHFPPQLSCRYRDGKSYPTGLPLGSSQCFGSRSKLKGLYLYLSRDHSQLCSLNGDLSAYELSDSHNSSPEVDGSGEKSAKHQRESPSSNDILKKLRRYGLAGVLSYGLLNTVYYLSAFLLVWFYVAPAPAGMGYLAAVERFLKLMAMVWAGSQVTKLVRAAGALVLAPIVDSGLSWFTVKFNFKSQGKAFLAIVGFCFGLAFVLFLFVTLLSA